MSTLPILVLIASILDATGHLSPEAFEFVLPGVTRKEVDKRLGKPWVSSIGVVARGEIDLFVDSIRLDNHPHEHASHRVPAQNEVAAVAVPLPTRQGLSGSAFTVRFRK